MVAERQSSLHEMRPYETKYRCSSCYAGAMYVVIVGAGEVGFYIATILSQEGHDVAIVDRDQEPYLSP